METEIGLSDGTKLTTDQTAREVTEGLEQMARSGGAAAPDGDWLELGDGVWFNPAQVVYVKDVTPPSTFDVID